MVNQRKAPQQSPRNLQITNAQLRDLPALPPLPPADLSNPYSVMLDTSVTSALNEAAKIKKLNGPNKWVE